MRQKSTDDLSQELMSQPNLDQYITENEAYFVETDLHQVFSGRRKPSRDRLLCLCIGMDAGLEAVQQLLKRVGYAPIYPKLKRDAIISHGMIHRTPLSEINETRFLQNEKTLF